MSHFYGTVQGSRGRATRCGSKAGGLRTIAASWEGAIAVQVHHDARRKRTVAEVRLIPWHGRGVDRLLWRGFISGSRRRPTPALQVDSAAFVGLIEQYLEGRKRLIDKAKENNP